MTKIKYQVVMTQYLKEKDTFTHRKKLELVQLL